MAANIEVLLDMCLGSCLKPGIVNLDLHALKRFLHDLSHGVQDLEKTNVQRIVDDLTLKFHKMVSDLEKVQSQIKEVQKDSNNIEELTRDVESIKMDLVDLAGCSRLMNSTLHKFREQLFDSPSKNTGTTDYLENVVVELVKRVENIEHRKGQRKSRGFTKHLLQAESKGVPGKGKKEKRTRHSLGFNDEKSSDEKVETPQCDPADGVELGPSSSSGTVALATAFREFTTLLNQTRLVKPPAVVKFLLLMKGSDEITPEMIKELMTVLSTSLVTKLITTMENSDGLTIEAIVTIVDMVQTLPFMHRALCTLLGAIQGDSSIPAAALLEIFEVLRSANFMEPKHLAKMLVNLSRQEGFLSLLLAASNNPIFSIANLLPLVRACKGVSRCGLMEIVTLMENMEPDDLKEMMSTLFTIPGYFTELLSSLPVLPSMEVQNLAFKVTSLSEEVRELIKEFINLTANSETSRFAVLQSLKEVISVVMDDHHLPDSWLVHLLNLFSKTNHVRTEHVVKFLSLLKDKKSLGSEAMHVFIDIFRLNELTPRALVDFLCALNDCGLTPEPLMHLLRMLSNSTSITTAGVHELLSFLEHTDLLHEDVFQELQEVANSCQLLVPSIITELMKLLKDANFTTLEDLCNAMQRLNFVSKDELDGHLRQMTHKHTQQMQILVTSCVLKEPEEEVLSRLAGVNEQPTPSSIPDVAEQQIISRNRSEEPLTADQAFTHNRPSDLAAAIGQRLPPEAVSILESKVAEVQANQTAILDILTPKGRPLDPQSPRRYRSDVTLPNIFPPHPSRYPVIRIVADKSVETEDEVKVSDSGRVESEAVNMLLEERKCHEQKIQLLEDAIKELQKKKADRKDLNQAKDTNHQQADLLRRFMKLSTINESHEEKIKSIIQRQDSQEALFVSEQEKVLQDLDKMATKTELQDFRHGIREEVISAVYQDILRDSSVGCTKRPLKLNCLSCDRKLICLPESPYSQMPALPGFPPARPERPHTVFELNMVRRHARSLLEPPNMLTVDFYALPRQAGGIQTEYVHKEWSSRCYFTYPAPTPDSFIRGADGRVYAGASQPVFLPPVTTTSMTSIGQRPRVMGHRPSARRSGRKK